MLGMASQLYNYTPTELQELLDESNSYKELLRKLSIILIKSEKMVI